MTKKLGRPTNKEVRYRNVGRPSVVTDKVVSKLEEAFAKGLTDLQACAVASISKEAFYNYCNRNPEFKDKKERLKQMPKVQAKYVINEALYSEEFDIRYDAAKYYAERKMKDEFGKNNTPELTQNNTNVFIGAEAVADRIKEIIDVTPSANIAEEKKESNNIKTIEEII